MPLAYRGWCAGLCSAWDLPVHDLNPAAPNPWVTYALVAANVIVLLLIPASRDSVTGPSAQAQLCSQTAFYDHYAAIPRELTTNHQLRQVATGQPGPRADTCYVSKPPYHKVPALSVLFAMFLHAGWLHLLGNMLFLVVFGNNIEDRFRKLPYLIFYLFCGYIAAYGFAFVNQTSVQPLIGASGAIAGVLGAYLAIYPRAKVWSLLPFLFFIPVRIPAWLVLGSWFVLQWLYSAGTPPPARATWPTWPMSSASWPASSSASSCAPHPRHRSTRSTPDTAQRSSKPASRYHLGRQARGYPRDHADVGRHRSGA